MPYKIFIVEDEIVTREGLRDCIDWQAAGYEFCGEAPDGELALPLIHERRPDIVITDIKMPFMDGLQLSRHIRESLPDTKIIILSGHDEFRYAQEAIKVGVTEYLLKPISEQELLGALHSVADRIDQEHQTARQLHDLQSQLALQQAPPAAESADAQPHNTLIAKAKAYIDSNYADPEISLSAVAAHVTLSPSYFSVMFGREIGENFIEYLTRVRIRKAMELLRSTGLSASEIGYQVGYHNPRYFSMVFRKVAGTSPNEFRRQVP
ncbi:MAG TPA: response regulator [Roseiflexaceae bacterium]|nr:response regulator [Roseiflexaceae bacterium]